MRKFLVFLIFLLVVLVAADRGLHYAAQSEIAKRVSQQYEMVGDPEVTIGGFPFLNQAVSGEYSEIHIVTGAMTVGEVQLERVDATLNDVRAPLDELMSEPNIVAGTANATVMLPYSELQKRLPEGLVIETENGTPRITGDIAYQGFSVGIESDIGIDVDGGTVMVTPSNISVGDAPIPTSWIEDQLAIAFEMPPLPFDLQLTGIKALPNGVQATAEGTDVQITGGGPQ
ncbi:hypothetical protein HDA32_000221 [Spinactinospora alkalitolerans]|uniref:DUF2993 domain-containing protein n=1 Tax=Spinactinospora alkalitolerans TaxID=687207 RepID=A0A852TNT4_9ACTN|nr:DUF2993 domain-containing protein [Spinactinospora alkalitolerans]NYE45101.1 hypothetical protein [Spinactinospora alkalitolerans]